jgi:hypothetical protein
MYRKFLLVFILGTSLVVFGQKGGGAGSGSTSGSAAGSGPAGAPGTVTPGGTPTTAGAVGGLAGQASSGTINPPSGNAGIPTVPETMGGPAGNTGTNQGNPANENTFPAGTNNTGFIGGTTGSGVLATPSATFASPEPTAGISDAGHAGISDSNPVSNGVQSTTENSTVVYTNSPAINPRAAGPAAAVSGGRLINDFSPSVYVGDKSTAASSQQTSVADVAARYKARSTENARTITNADVERMLSGHSGGPSDMANMPNSDPQQTAQNGSTPDATAGQNNASSGSATQDSSAQNGAANVQGNAGAQAASSATTPQINPQATQGQAATEGDSGNRLPATSTFLPLLGLLGITSSGVGLWFRKFRK